MSRNEFIKLNHPVRDNPNKINSNSKRWRDNSILKEKQFFVIENLAKSMTKEAKTIGMSLEELQEILSLIYEEEE